MDEATQKALAAHKREIEALNGEIFANQALLFALMLNLQRGTPDPIRATFDDAARYVEDAAISKGKAASPHHLVKALRIVEEIRANILGKDAPTKKHV